jgi:hypothetical protein
LPIRIATGDHGPHIGAKTVSGFKDSDAAQESEDCHLAVPITE